MQLKRFAADLRRITPICLCSVQRESGAERSLPRGTVEWKAVVLLPVVDTLRGGLRHLQLLVLQAVKRNEPVLDVHFELHLGRWKHRRHHCRHNWSTTDDQLRGEQQSHRSLAGSFYYRFVPDPNIFLFSSSLSSAFSANYARSSRFVKEKKKESDLRVSFACRRSLERSKTKLLFAAWIRHDGITLHDNIF